MGQLWIPGAEKISGAQNGGDMVGGPPRATEHITDDKLNSDGTRPNGLFDDVAGYLVRERFQPTVMIDPFTGRIVQFQPADRSAYALESHPGGAETNRQGEVNVQCEWLFTCGTRVDGKVYTYLTDTPLRGGEEWLAFCESWQIPATFPSGNPGVVNRDINNWRNVAGHYGHSQVPEQWQNHTDPEHLDLGKFFGVGDAGTPDKEDDVKAMWVLAPGSHAQYALDVLGKRHIPTPGQVKAWQNLGLLETTLRDLDDPKHKDEKVLFGQVPESKNP